MIHVRNSGRLSTQNVLRVYAQSEIILCVGAVGHCNNFYALKLRDFDAPISDTFYLTSDNPDLYSLFEIGKEIETYKGRQDCINNTKWFLAHTQERQTTAAACRQRVLRVNALYQRFSGLIDTQRNDASCVE